MADVNNIPQIRCDNCGCVTNKIKGQFEKEYRKPSMWGGVRIDGGRATDSYGGKSKLVMTDLCITCANAAIDAASEALKAIREPSNG